MDNQTVWDFWAGRYEKLWVQKHSLYPTRQQVAAAVIEAAAGIGHGPLRLLDVGCGTGQLCAELASRLPRQRSGDWQITGVDLSPAMTTAASRKKIPGCRFLQGDAQQLPLESGQFHLVSCCHSLPYYRDQAAAVRELARVVRPGGTVVLAQAAVESRYDAMILSLVKLTTGRAVYPPAGQVRRLLENAGLMEIRQWPLPTAAWMPTILISTARRCQP